jgi:hypothetical protein
MRFHRGEPATARSESENDPRWQRLHAPDIGRFKRRAGSACRPDALAGRGMMVAACADRRPEKASMHSVPLR